MNKPTQQQVVEAYKKLPPPVREFLADPDQLARVLTDIKNAHDLHVDVIGQVNESIGYFLLGLASSSEFRDALKSLGVPESTTNDIIAEMNKRIFAPLREQMMKGPTATSVSAKPVVSAPVEIKPPQAQAPIVPVKPPEPAPAIPRLVVPTAPTPLRPEVRPAPRPSVAPSGVGPVAPKVEPPAAPEKFFHLQNKIPPAPAAPRPPAPSLREVLAAVTAEKHSQAPTPPISPPVPTLPANLPGALQPQPIPEVRSSPVIPKVEPQVPKPIVPPAPPPPAKPYNVDPYREPIE